MQFARRLVNHLQKVIVRDARRRRRRRKRAYQARVLPEALAHIAAGTLTWALNREARDRKITVSLTSYPARFATLDIVLKRLMDQTMKPDRLILYLDDHIPPSQVPEAVRDLARFGLEIQFVPYDLKPHKKYFFAMQAFPRMWSHRGRRYRLPARTGGDPRRLLAQVSGLRQRAARPQDHL
jgi:hypothetical protein